MSLISPSTYLGYVVPACKINQNLKICLGRDVGQEKDAPNCFSEIILGTKTLKWEFYVLVIAIPSIGLTRRLSGKDSTCQCRRYRWCEFDPWGQENPLEEGIATHSSTLGGICYCIYFNNLIECLPCASFCVMDKD